ncbi:MAG: DUF502 domain-containing protein [Planctomycetota bacterium]|jgi:uncharacterized membrane protein
MKKQLKIFLTGLFVVVPFAITVWVIWEVGLWLDGMGRGILAPIWDRFEIESPRLEDLHGVGAGLLIVAIYLLGVLMHLWLFRRAVGLFERVFERVPGVKTIYESVRDLMKLFGSESRKMGRVVEYQVDESDVGVLGILTNEQPSGIEHAGKVAVYFPFAYMIGGPVLFVPRDRLREVDMPVERALRLCATAQVGIGESLQNAKNLTKTAQGNEGSESRDESQSK